MDLQQYRQRRKIQLEEQKDTRNLCTDCWQPDFNCYCHAIEKFDPHIEFVVLIHPVEARRRIATGRMSYLSLENSHIIRGMSFADCPTVGRLLADSNYHNVMLARGEGSIDLTNMSEQQKEKHFTSDKKLRVFVIDGTWTNAGKMITRSPNLQKLPRFCFTPDKPSNIRVRKQPNPLCYCTLEAIHHLIGLLGPSQGFDVSGRTHDNLLKPFNWMVGQQVERLREELKWREISRNPTGPSWERKKE